MCVPFYASWLEYIFKYGEGTEQWKGLWPLPLLLNMSPYIELNLCVHSPATSSVLRPVQEVLDCAQPCSPFPFPRALNQCINAVVLCVHCVHSVFYFLSVTGVCFCHILPY